MFGYVTADLTQLSEEEKARYQGCYCGLCRRLGTCCGQRCRLTLTYDLTFLILVLNSVYGGEEQEGRGGCIAHPFHNHNSWSSRWSDYAAWMNTALSYYKCEDDWQDDRKASARIAAAALHGPLKKAEELYPRQCEAMKRELAVLSEIEKRGLTDPDAAAASFGRLMAALFVPDEGDENARSLWALGYYLGEFIYLTDARLDLSDDLKNEKYNPLTGMLNPDMEPALTMLIGQAAKAAEALPLKKDANIIFDIIYSGVWIKYRAWAQKREEEANV